MTDSSTDEVRVMMEAMLDHQINGRTSRFYEKYLQVFAALPLIRAAALEEAADEAEVFSRHENWEVMSVVSKIAARIRALKEQP
jgi:hypothetical protein